MKLFYGMMGMRIMYDANNGGGSGGGAGGAGAGAGAGNDAAKALSDAQAALKAANDKIAELEKGKKKDDVTPPGKNDDEDLIAKAARERADAEKRQMDTKAIESALKFNLGLTEFLKVNEGVFPKEIGEIVKVAEKENYNTAADKPNAVKACVIQSFFSVQANLDLLTASQKDSVADFLKLTKDGREAKAPQVYDGIFEPALETLKKVKKAEELGKSRAGFANSDGSLGDYKQRLIDGAKKSFLKQKGAN